ncbi:MAG: toll/interleukin-1 receptor domain-containing protein [Erysipelotrichales bacterium]|nr:toll/interleukin-1 receptor domain-containing protein [Erysipelotrichales bacterium]
MTYDVFISYKSEDIEYARRIYNELKNINKNLCVFLAERSLKDIGEAKYANAIEEAIKSSRNMIIVASNHEYFSSNWVNYEWRLFFHYQLTDKSNFYHNIITATKSIDYMRLPDALQLCENVSINDFTKMYEYIINKNQEDVLKNGSERQVKFLESSLEKAGWKNTVFFSPSQLSEYESGNNECLKSVTILSHTLNEDTPGGALFDTVEKNLLSKIVYNYIFLDAANAKNLLKKIYFAHTTEARRYLRLEKSNESFWVFGNFANVTIYEYKDRPTDGYFRIKTEITRGVEKSIFIKLSENIIDRIENQIEEYRENGKIIPQQFIE